MKNKRLRNILAAGALTGLVLATLIAFSWPNSPGEADAAPSTQAGTATGDEEATAGESSLQAENEQLRSALQTMQDREQQYQAQIEAANRTILQLQAGPNGSARYADDDDDHYEGDERYEDDDRYEDGDHEEEEHEGEHEKYEEHDDD